MDTSVGLQLIGGDMRLNVVNIKLKRQNVRQIAA